MNSPLHYLLPDWPEQPNIHAVTTLRTGGVSVTPFASLNLAFHVGDNPSHVAQNRTLIKKNLGLPAEPCWLQQTHSNSFIEAPFSVPVPQADASYTRQANVVCVVMTADCLPLLVRAEDGSCIAAIHAGWRGLHAGIISNTILAMPKKKYQIWLGPALGGHCFEVGADVYSAFTAKSSTNNQAFKAQANGKWLADIYRLARLELAQLGIAEADIYGGGLCTMTDAGRFYSYRREAQTGRMATMIWRSE